MPELKAVNHINAITRGGPSNPDDIVVVIPGTTFTDILDWERTVHHMLNNRTFDCSEEAIEYVGDLIKKYSDAKITVGWVFDGRENCDANRHGLP
ncbi:hypothetical protein HXA35_18875 [Bacillus sp. A301a_S52]|nr:hypothetical protein [Bacillus sp. A301a_S52]